MNKYNDVEQQEVAKLRWRCHRGMLELDLFLLPFVEQQYTNLTQDDKNSFLSLLETPDPELYAWLMGHEQPESKEFANLVAKIRNHRHQAF